MVSDKGTVEDGGRSILIRHALALLNDVHPEDLSIREVARRAEMSSGAPYHHFKTKSDLLAACAVVAWTDLCDQLEAAGEGDPCQQLIQRASSYLAYARANPGPYQLITSRLLDNAHRFADIVALRERAIRGVISLITSASDPAIDQQTAKFRGVSMWSMLHGHLILDSELQAPAGSHSALDGAVARLATRMALLTVEA